MKHPLTAVLDLIPVPAGFIATAYTERVAVPIAVAVIAAAPAIMARVQGKRHAEEATHLGERLTAVETKVDLLVEHFIPARPEHE